jgi:hypothetical protein
VRNYYLITIIFLSLNASTHQISDSSTPAEQEETCGEKPSAFKETLNSWAVRILTPLGIGLGLYGLSRWTISNKTGIKELDAWVVSQNKSLKQSSYHQVIFFRGWSYGETERDPVDAEVCLSKMIPPELKIRYYAPGSKNIRRFNSFAQKWDVYHMKKQIEHVLSLKSSPLAKTLVFAHCASASTLIATLAQYPDLADRLDGIVLLAPFSDIAEIEGPLNVIPKPLRSKWLVKRVIQATIAPNYSCSGKTPLEWILTGSIPKTLPIILIHSQDDTVVPISHYDKLQNTFMRQQYPLFYSIKRSAGGHFPFLLLSGKEGKEDKKQISEIISREMLKIKTCQNK